MSKAPEHFRPFDIEQAKAGAPYGCIGGYKATILKWDCANPTYPLVGVCCDNDYPESWAADGSQSKNGDTPREKDRNLVMLPLGMCEGKPVFVGDMLHSLHDGQIYEAMIGWYKEMDESLWQWPRPKPEYPEFTQSEVSTWKDWCGPNWQVSFANAAMRHAIDGGKVVPVEMLEKVAKEVQKAYTQVRGAGGAGGGGGASSSGPGGGGSGMWVNGNWIAGGGSGMGAGSIVPVYVVDIAAIIKRVKEGQA